MVDGQCRQVFIPIDQIRAYPGEPLTIADQDPGGIHCAGERFYPITGIKRPQYKEGPARPGPQVSAIFIYIGPITLWSLCGVEGGCRKVVRVDGWRGIRRQNRQLVYIIDPLHQVTAQPACCQTIAHQHPGAVLAAIEGANLLPLGKSTNARVVSAGTAAHVYINGDDGIDRQRCRRLSILSQQRASVKAHADEARQQKNTE